MLEQSFHKIQSTIAEAGHTSQKVEIGGPDKGNAHWYKFQVVSEAREAGKYANFSEDHYFVKATIQANREGLLFVISFHHVGRELTGIMESTAFARLESFEDSEDREPVGEKFFVCSIEPFVFTHRTDPKEIGEAFARWLDQALAIALKEYADRL